MIKLPKQIRFCREGTHTEASLGVFTHSWCEVRIWEGGQRAATEKQRNCVNFQQISWDLEEWSFDFKEQDPRGKKNVSLSTQSFSPQGTYLFLAVEGKRLRSETKDSWKPEQNFGTFMVLGVIKVGVWDPSGRVGPQRTSRLLVEFSRGLYHWKREARGRPSLMKL